MNNKRLPIWALVLIDLLGAALCLGIVVLVVYVIPRGTAVQEQESDSETVQQFALPDSGSGQTETKQKNEVFSKSSQNAWSHTVTGTLAASEQEINAFYETEKTRKTIQQDKTDTYSLTIEQVSCEIAGEPIEYFVADLYVTSIQNFKTAFANDMYGQNIRASVKTMANKHNAVLAMSGDSYGESEQTCVIRNGELYSEDPGTSDVCVLYRDGTMKTYHASQFDAQTVLNNGAWQAWTFGPSLLDEDGQPYSEFYTTEYINKVNPRAAIGYIAPGHYKLVIVDGRQDDYSVGVTISQLAALMHEEGCTTAYNLDGGKTAVMVYDGETVNRPIGSGRPISDCIYLGG